MAKNKRLRQAVDQEIGLRDRPTPSGLTGRMAGPRPPKELKPHQHKEVARAGVRFMNSTDPDDNLMEFHPSKREHAMRRGRRTRKKGMRRR